jgi:dienelactone hydrolase
MNKNLDYTTLPYLWSSFASKEPELSCKVNNVAEWESWRDRARQQLISLLGGFPDEKVPLETVVLESEETEEYTVEKVAYQSHKDVYIPCFVLKPKGIKPPYRPVIALHGHGSGGADHIVGKTTDESHRQEEEDFIKECHYDYGKEYAKRGFMVFAPTTTGFGERMEKWPNMTHANIFEHEGEWLWRSSCRAVAFHSLIQGKTAVGHSVWDVIRTIDYIHARPEKMIKGIGLVGFSGGGMNTMYSAAIDPRVTVAVISAYFNSFSFFKYAIHCECNYIPGITRYFDMSDIVSLNAPRPTLIVSGTEDPIFPVETTKEEFEEVCKTYKVHGAEDKLDLDIFEGSHRFNGEKAFDFMEKWLR